MRVNWHQSTYRINREHYTWHWQQVVKDLLQQYGEETEYGYSKAELELWRRAAEIRARLITYGSRRDKTYYRLLAQEDTLLTCIHNNFREAV